MSTGGITLSDKTKNSQISHGTRWEREIDPHSEDFSNFSRVLQSTPIAEYLQCADEGVGLCSQQNPRHTGRIQIYKQRNADLQYSAYFFRLKILLQFLA